MKRITITDLEGNIEYKATLRWEVAECIKSLVRVLIRVPQGEEEE